MANGLAKLRASAEERFFSKVDKTGSCWIWNGAITTNGYGVFQKGRRGELLYKAHRFSYELHKGEIPKGGLVLHSCDNKRCVNPDHLSVGDHSRNIKEAYDRKIRTISTATIERIGNMNKKLSDADRRGIRIASESGFSGSEIGLIYGVSKTTICRILKR